jgi:lactam utilization protein B
MSVEDPIVVDAIGEDPETGKLVLTISDHMSWSDENHFARLEEKVRGYVGFIESGQLLERFAKGAGREVEIRLVCKHGPTDEAVPFLESIRAAIERRGISFRHKTLHQPS